MHLRIRFIGKALDHVLENGGEDRHYPLHIQPELMHVGDLVRHPLFPGRAVYVVAREIDLIDCCVTVWIDELPEYGRRASDRAAADAAPAVAPDSGADVAPARTSYSDVAAA